ncbi:MAG: SPFH domain-containing protein [Paludibacteraceae bacterium]
MGFFSKDEGGIMDVIRCDEPDYLIWKWHPGNLPANSTKKENAIRWGSSLRVKDGEVAIFVYRQKNGTIQDVITGPYDEILKTDNLPVLSSILGLAYNGKSPFQAEVYFINTAGIIQIPFVIPYFSVYDPRFSDFSCPVAVRGKITFCMADYQRFIKLHRLIDFNLEQFSEQVTAGIKKYAKSFISNAPTKFNFPVIQIERFILELSDAMKTSLEKEMLDDFGIVLKRVDLSSINCDKESEEYQKLYKLTGKQKTKQVVFSTDMGMVTQAISGIDDLRDNRKRRQIERKNMERREKLSTETEFLATHVVNSRMGGLFQKLGFGSKYANERIASDMQTAQVINGTGKKDTITFYAVVDGQQKGPFSITTIREMYDAGLVSGQTYFWKEGFPDWKHAVDIPELTSIFAPNVPPTPPAIPNN